MILDRPPIMAAFSFEIDFIVVTGIFACMYSNASSQDKDINTYAPSAMVRQFHGLVEGNRALDIGCSSDAVFLAGKGFELISFDSSAQNVENAIKLADKHDVEIDFRTQDALQFKYHKSRYSLITINNILGQIRKSELDDLIEKINYALRRGGIITGKAFTVDDPSFKELRKKKVPEIEKNCFLLPNGWIYSFFEQREILDLFPEMRILHYSVADTFESHQGRQGWRGIVEFAFRKQKA